LPRNGSGSYSPPSNTWNPATPETPILSDDWNATLADMATAITQSIASDGQTTTSAPIPFSQGIRFIGGTVSAPSFSIIGDTDTGFYTPAANQMAIAVGGVQGFLITSIGITVPLALTVGDNVSIALSLTVGGPAIFNGNVTVGNADTDTLTVEATGTFNGPQTFADTITVPDASFSNAKLATVATATIKGRVTAGTGVVEDLTATQATTLINAVVGATQSVAGTKGAVPAAAAGDQHKVLTGAGTFQAGYGRAFGCVITTTNVNGSQPTFTNGVNVASLSTLTVVGALATCTITFTDALPNATFAIHGATNGNTGADSADFAYGVKTTTSVVVYWGIAGGAPTEISVSGFA
jgi:hypothetical protein